MKNTKDLKQQVLKHIKTRTANIEKLARELSRVEVWTDELDKVSSENHNSDFDTMVRIHRDYGNEWEVEYV